MVIGGLLIVSLTGNIFDYQQKIKFFEQYKKELTEKEEKNKELKSEAVKAKDYYQVEKKIREKLNLLRPDEVAVILPQETPTPTPTPKQEKPPLRQWIELFGLK